MQTLALNTVLFDYDTRAADDLAWVTLAINFAKTGPGSEDFGISNLEKELMII